MNPKDMKPDLSPLLSVKLLGLFGDRNASIDLADRSVTLLFGQNGVGKSTLLRVVARMLGSKISNLPQDPITAANLVFADGATMDYSAGPPARWSDRLPDGSEATGEIADLSALELDPQFHEFIEHETPYFVRDGKVVSPGGRPMPGPMLEQFRSTFLRRRSRTQRDALQAPMQDGRRLIRQCFLIGSDRLEGRILGGDVRKGYEGPMRYRYDPDADVAEQISQHLIHLITQARQDALKRSSSLDGSFITRAVGTLQDSEPLPDVERQRLVVKISELQKRLVNCGLASTSLEIPTLGNDSSEVKKIFDLYLKDLLSKAEATESVLPKLELFEEILNSHFTDKVARLQAEGGLIIQRRATGTPVPLERLSSGERHLIVLFHHLIFRTTPGGLCLIDEPEISLHVDWQERFIESIAKVAKVSPQQYVIATHSPSIVGRHESLMRELVAEPVNR